MQIQEKFSKMAKTKKIKIDLTKMNFKFAKKPLLFGGAAMEYYGLRKRGDDIDLVACREDIESLVRKYPKNLKDVWGDFGVVVGDFEVWKSVDYLYYEDLVKDAIEEDDFYVISLKNILYQKSMAMKKSKYLEDLKLVVEKIQEVEGEKYQSIKKENEEIVSSISSKIEYIEKIGH